MPFCCGPCLWATCVFVLFCSSVLVSFVARAGDLMHLNTYVFGCEKLAAAKAINDQSDPRQHDPNWVAYVFGDGRCAKLSPRSVWEPIGPNIEGFRRVAYRGTEGRPNAFYVPVSALSVPVDEAGVVTSRQRQTPTIILTECEGTGGCGRWIFHGRRGVGTWPYGAIASLSWDGEQSGLIAIHRSDTTGTSPGLTATYTGSRTGNRISGTVVWSWPGHWNGKPGSGQWRATLDTKSQYQTDTPHAQSGVITWNELGRLLTDPTPSGVTPLDAIGAAAALSAPDPEKLRVMDCFRSKGVSEARAAEMAGNGDECSN